MTRTDLNPRVFVIDDDVEFANSVAWLLGSVDLKAVRFTSAQAFLGVVTERDVGCIVTDVRMPEISGLELQRKVQDRGLNLPIIIMTAHGDVDTAVLAMKNGAVDFIQKPFNDQQFIDLVQTSIGLSVQRANAISKDQRLLKRLSELTPRERQVMDLIVDGKTNRQIAEVLSISEKTVESHRSQVMNKTEALSLVELVKLAMRSANSTS